VGSCCVRERCCNSQWDAARGTDRCRRGKLPTGVLSSHAVVLRSGLPLRRAAATAVWESRGRCRVTVEKARTAAEVDSLPTELNLRHVSSRWGVAYIYSTYMCVRVCVCFAIVCVCVCESKWMQCVCQSVAMCRSVLLCATMCCGVAHVGPDSGCRTSQVVKRWWISGTHTHDR